MSAHKKIAFFERNKGDVYMRRGSIAASLALLLLVGRQNGFGQGKRPDECGRTAEMEIYSDAQVSRVTGDLSGFELALDKPNGSQRKALLFIYEGAESEGIPLDATADGNSMVIQGTWVEHLIEYPSKKEFVQTHRVKISGKLTPKTFRGDISIEDFGIGNPENMQLKRVKRIWACKAHSPSSFR